MTALTDSYFDNIFEALLRESLASRNRRRVLVDHIKRLIDALPSAEEGCHAAVTAIVQYHRKTLAENGSVCLLGKYHDVLYVAVKLCFDFRLATGIVTDLLQDIFHCEKTFERILAGAIYGVTVTHFITGWKSDFRDQRENVFAVDYFLQKAADKKMVFRVQTRAGLELRKFADVPIGSCDRTPLVAALQVVNTDVVLLLLRFDASLSFPFFEAYPQGEEVAQEEPECMRMVLRAAPSFARLDIKNSRYEDAFAAGSWGDAALVPPRLKHLCRCEIRDGLRRNSMLPLGIPRLGLPHSLRDYLDLLSD